MPPGQYYLRVDLDDYARPLSQFTAAELKAPTPGIEERIQRELQLINVTPNSALVADVTLRRSGSITGRIMYDDGSPVIATSVELARRDTNGKFADVGLIGYLTGSLTLTLRRIRQCDREKCPCGLRLSVGTERFISIR